MRAQFDDVKVSRSVSFELLRHIRERDSPESAVAEKRILDRVLAAHVESRKAA